MNADHDDLLISTLRSSLRQGAHELNLTGPGAAGIATLHRRRQRRHHAVMAGVAVAVLSVGGLALVAGRGDGSGQHTVTDVAVAPLTGEGSVSFTWSTAEQTIGFSQTAFTGSDGYYYALSTAPGTPGRSNDWQPANTLYRSLDGVTWEDTKLGPDPWVSDMAERTGVLYALGTAPATVGTKAQVGVSNDGGATWDRQDLAPAATPPEGLTVPVLGTNVTTKLAVGPDRMLAAVSTSFWIDIEAAAGIDDHSSAEYAQSAPEGIQIVDDNECTVESGPADGASRPLAPTIAPSPGQIPDEAAEAVETVEVEPELQFDPSASPCEAVVQRTIPWSNIGLNSQDDLRNRRLFSSTDGTTWEEVNADLPGQISDLISTPNGFVATAWSPNFESLDAFISVDGQEWSPVAVPTASEGESGISIHVVGQRLIAIEQPTEEDFEAINVLQAHASADGGATWTTTDLDALLPGLDPAGEISSPERAVATGPLGLAVVIRNWSVADSADTHLYLMFSEDGIAWSVTPLDDLASATGTNINWVEWVMVNENQIIFSGHREENNNDVASTFVGTPVR